MTFSVGDRVKTKKGVGKYVGSIGGAAYVNIGNNVERVRMEDIQPTEESFSESLPNKDRPVLEEYRKAEADHQRSEVQTITVEDVGKVEDVLGVEFIHTDDPPEKVKMLITGKDAETGKTVTIEAPEPVTIGNEDGSFSSDNFEDSINLPDLTKEFLLVTDVEELKRLLKKFGDGISKPRRAKLRRVIKGKGGEL